MREVRWTRRELLRQAAAAAAHSITSASLGRALGAGEQSAADLTTPDWIAPGKLRWVWALWEPMALYARGGSAAGIGDGRATGHWVRRWYERMHSDEILDKLADAGVNLISTCFYKGFGLRAEADEMARAADFTRRAHQRGIRVLGYHQFTTVIYETMLDEAPDLEQWIQRGPDGRLRTYGGAEWRWLACPSHDQFIGYLKRVIDRCLIEADMDGVEYDGDTYDCHCPRCQELFRSHLADQNPEPRDRFGLPHFRHVRVPSAADPKNPIWQEWIRFRMRFMGRRFREMRAYVHQKKPGAALVTYEDCPALWSKTRTRLSPDQGDYLDLAIAESHDMPQVLDGELVTKVRHLKEGQAIGRTVLSTNWLRTPGGGIQLPGDARPVELDMAECLACGGQVVTATWALRSGGRRDGSAFFEHPPFHEALKRYMAFARRHEELYVGSEPCANVWVYHSTWSLAYDLPGAYNSILGFEQALLGRIAYRVGKERHLAALGRRDVLILANLRCLSDLECEAIRGAVSRGCGVILTGDTAACDENFREREGPALAELRRHGRVRWFEACPGKTSQPSYSYAAGQALRPAMPRRAAEIVRTVRELAQEGLAVELDAGDQLQPLTYTDVYRRRGGGCAAHVVDYGDQPRQNLRLRVAPWLPHAKPALYSPYLASPAPLAIAADGWIALPSSMGRYGCVAFASPGNEGAG